MNTTEKALPIKGRMLKEPSATVHVQDGRIVLQFADTLVPEWWMQLHVDSVQLIDWLQLIAVQRTGDNRHALNVLQALRDEMIG